jgi:hypothetical protein
MTMSPEAQTPGTGTPVYHVFTDAQMKELLASVTPGPGFVAKAETVAKTGAEDVLANIKALIVDAEGTVGHVHGAAKQFQADVKANRWQIIIGIAAFASLVLHLAPLVRGFL